MHVERTLLEERVAYEAVFDKSVCDACAHGMEERSRGGDVLPIERNTSES